MDHDQKLLIHAEMLSLLENIPASLVERHPVQFLMHLDQVRQKAAQHHLTALHDLSCAFETALQQAFQNGTGLITAKSYLDAMQDALGAGRMEAGMTEALMANVALRLGGQP